MAALPSSISAGMSRQSAMGSMQMKVSTWLVPLCFSCSTSGFRSGSKISTFASLRISDDSNSS